MNISHKQAGETLFEKNMHRINTFRLSILGPAVRFSETPTVLNHAPPVLGQHTRSVLKEVLNMHDEDIDSLIMNGVIK